MSVMDKLFGRVTATGGTGSTVAAPGPTLTAAPPADPTAIVNNTAVVEEEKDDSPLAKYADFWDTPVDKDGKPIVQTDPLSSPVFKFDPAKVQEQAKKLDFTKDVNPELMAKVAAGGAESIPALMELLNFVQQNSFAAATLAMGNMVNQGLATHTQQLRQSLPRDIKRSQLQSAEIEDETGVLTHPAVQPLVYALRQAAFNKDANANPTEVAARVNGLILGLAEAVAVSKAKTATTTTAAATTNWGNYFGDTQQQSAA